MAIFKRTVNGKTSETFYMAFRFGGKQYLRNTWTAERAKALQMEAARKRKVREGRAAEFIAALDGIRGRRAVCTVGEIIKAYLANDVKLMADATQTKRVANDLRLVIAHGRNLWAVHEGGVRGVKLGSQIPDAARIDALPASVLTRGLVRDYFRARLGGTLDVTVAAEGNVSINSTLKHARGIFSERARAYKLEELSLPDLTGFLKEPLLPVLAGGPDPVKEPLFSAMVEAARAMGGDIGLVNLILRQTGMRSGSVEHLHEDWLEKMADGWWLHVRKRKRGTAEYSIPVSDELAGIMRKRKGFTLGGTEASRRELVHVAHNEWLKQIIGGAGERTQGNHRLRDTVATILMSWRGLEAAKLALGHADERTTLKHYARLRLDVSDVMRSELVAWSRLAKFTAASAS